jgi:hypothetical protein
MLAVSRTKQPYQALPIRTAARPGPFVAAAAAGASRLMNISMSDR